MKYSQHLDWHFRQNRRDRDNTRKAQSRKWYYDVSDWIQFEEIEDLEERGTVFLTFVGGLFEDEVNTFRSWDQMGLLR
jgi:pre-mRNA cleavage complex 2 protein Pcf11